MYSLDSINERVMGLDSDVRFQPWRCAALSIHLLEAWRPDKDKTAWRDDVQKLCVKLKRRIFRNVTLQPQNLEVFSLSGLLARNDGLFFMEIVVHDVCDASQFFTSGTCPVTELERRTTSSATAFQKSARSVLGATFAR